VAQSLIIQTNMVIPVITNQRSRMQQPKLLSTIRLAMSCNQAVDNDKRGCEYLKVCDKARRCGLVLTASLSDELLPLCDITISTNSGTLFKDKYVSGVR
jgi:hypothetical protein